MDAFEIAGLVVPLTAAEDRLAELEAVYAEFDVLTAQFRSDERNPHLCGAGCSHCCRNGAFFAVTLVESLRLRLAVERLAKASGVRVREEAEGLLALQREAFGELAGPSDVPGQRDEDTFSARISRVNQRHPSCPLLEGDLCGVYGDRPFLCRAYGYPVDAYAVKTGQFVIFRSLCHLYEGLETADYVRAETLKDRLSDISDRLCSGAVRGRFTSAEAILATVRLSGND